MRILTVLLAVLCAAAVVTASPIQTLRMHTRDKENDNGNGVGNGNGNDDQNNGQGNGGQDNGNGNGNDDPPPPPPPVIDPTVRVLDPVFVNKVANFLILDFNGGIFIPLTA